MAPNQIDGSFTVVLYGLPTECWQCNRRSYPLVAMRRAVGQSEPNLVQCNDPILLEFAASLLPPVAKEVGEIKLRTSRTEGRAYLSNGCPTCDALFGNFFLFHEDLPEVLTAEGLDGLRVLAEVQVSHDVWRRTMDDPGRSLIP